MTYTPPTQEFLTEARKNILQHPYIKITGCKDHLNWYAPRIGEMIKVVGVDSEGYWAREGAPYFAVNIIRFEDAEWVPLPKGNRK